MNNLRLGDIAPNFDAETTQGSINFYEWLGDAWGVLFSHPADFTPVCTTELGTLANFKEEFLERNVKVLALSVDDLDAHMAWIKDINETQNTEVNFPIIDDSKRVVSQLYGMIHPNEDATMTVRSVFIINPKKQVKLILAYPASTGRNFYEILRVIDSLQMTEYKALATPANWEYGEDMVILPSVSNEEADALFPKGYKAVKPYLRLTPTP
ncbi:peroxiredoxin [Winogradskyella sp.]|uniref:peroxiredoxin n=1 Tax=Winogradskyella sp. TaxID=1883156 RepID=UPI003BAA3898